MPMHLFHWWLWKNIIYKENTPYIAMGLISFLSTLLSLKLAVLTWSVHKHLLI